MKRPPASTPLLYAQDGMGYDATVHAHYFLGAHDWFVTEYDPATGVAFGWACLGGDLANAELGYVDLGELASVRAPLRLGTATLPGALAVEHDDYWQPVPLRVALASRYGQTYADTLPPTRLRGAALRKARRDQREGGA